MVDYYGLPAGQNGWPGRGHSAGLDFSGRAAYVEAAIHADICATFGEGFDGSRFVPYVTMHEFEALLFSDCGVLAECSGQPSAVDALMQIRAQFETPEHINDSPQTAPSKRVREVIPAYQKVFNGALAASCIGIENMSNECPGFRRWIAGLVALSN